MTNFIKIPTIHPDNVEADTNNWVREDEIFMMQEATPVDKKRRSDIKTIVSCKNGYSFGTSLTPAEVIELIQESIHG